jgi:hypothetical protein
VNGFEGSSEAVRIIKECETRYTDTIEAKLVG